MGRSWVLAGCKAGGLFLRDLDLLALNSSVEVANGIPEVGLPVDAGDLDLDCAEPSRVSRLLSF